MLVPYYEEILVPAKNLSCRIASDIVRDSFFAMVSGVHHTLKSFTLAPIAHRCLRENSRSLIFGSMIWMILDTSDNTKSICGFVQFKDFLNSSFVNVSFSRQFPLPGVNLLKSSQRPSVYSSVGFKGLTLNM
jgi:hypothetical protein